MLELGKGKRLNIYTDSWCARASVRAHGTIWEESGMLPQAG